MNLRQLPRLWQLYRQRQRSELDYRAFQAFQSQLLLDYLARNGVTLAGRRVLDLGSGVSGYSRVFAEQGAVVVAADLVLPRGLAGGALRPVRGDARAVPLADAAVDFVFCASLIEHVAEPERVLAEIERVLRPGARAYVSFPPYYSPVGGHEFSPYHYLGERFAMQMVRRSFKVPEWTRALYQIPENPQSFAELYDGWGLFRMTIRKFRRLLAGTGLVCLNSATRYLPVSFVKWPLVGELLTWHAQFILSKPAADAAAAPTGTRP